MAEEATTTTKPVSSTLPSFLYYICERKDERPLYILATSQTRAVDGAKWFLGGSPVVGVAKDKPVTGFTTVVEVINPKEGHCGFVTKTFAN